VIRLLLEINLGSETSGNQLMEISWLEVISAIPAI
jgi:hypothetical protein